MFLPKLQNLLTKEKKEIAMTCKIANEISLDKLVESWGYKKLKSHKSGTEYFYENPLREETKSSFSINIQKNMWVDFGQSASQSNKTFLGGRVIDLIMARENTDVKGALNWLKNNSGQIDISSIENKFNNVPFIAPPARFIFKAEKEIFSYVLKDYLKERGIDLNIAKKHVKEIRFYDTKNEKTFFALGLKNNSGGYALRNKNRSVVLTPHDIRYIPSRSIGDTILIFEGLFDFLSYLMIKKTSEPKEDIIILNTLAHTKKAVSQIRNLDKPLSVQNMNNALLELSKLSLEFYVANDTFKGFDDLAEYWQNTQVVDELVFSRYQ